MDGDWMSDDTSGFYKAQGTPPEAILLHGPNYVLNAQYTLRREDRDSYTYPVDGWAWYDSEAEARSALGLPPIDATINPVP